MTAAFVRVNAFDMTTTKSKRRKAPSASKAANGETLAIFTRLTVKERKALNRLKKASGLPSREIVARLLVRADRDRAAGAMPGELAQ